MVGRNGVHENLPHREEEFCKCSPLKTLNSQPPSSSCVLKIMNSFQGGKNFTVENADKHCFSQVIKNNINTEKAH